MPPTIHLAETGSTNDWVRAHAAQLQDGQWVRTDRQTRGRGRMGRAWAMPAGNLAASCLVRPGRDESRIAELSFVAALALFDAATGFVPQARLRLKWPNDLLLDGAKLSGILLEREGAIVVIGIGVNLAAAPAIEGRATIALADAGAQASPEAFLVPLADAFARWRGVWRDAGFADIRTAWLARAHPPGTRLSVIHGGQPLVGAFAGLAGDGALELEDDSGARHLVHAGDILAVGAR